MPAANEEKKIAWCIEEIMNLPYDLYLYIVIDSYSKDRTEEIIKEYEEKTERVKLVFYKESKGVVSCYLEGFRRALEDGADQIIEMDAGGSHLPEELGQFIDKLEEGYQCVWGSRFMRGGGMQEHPLYRKILSSGGTILANIVLGTKLKDMTSGFEAFDRKILEKMDLEKFLSTGHMYQTEMRYYLRNEKSTEVPIHYIGSDSVIKLQSVTEALKLLFQLKENEKYIFNEAVEREE